jgi:hypothetical protein
MNTVVCIGTGPSLTLEQIDIARQKGFRLFGCNRVFEIVPDLELLYAVNLAFWDEYGEAAKTHGAELWTTNQRAAAKHGLHHICERNAPGLSIDPDYIHHGHGSGYSLVSMAHKMGAERILLLGYDLKYAPDYDGRSRKVGSSPRHYFGEYPASMQHWPSVQVKGGVHVELLSLYKSIFEQGLVEIVNCTPGSALQGVIPSALIEGLS